MKAPEQYPLRKYRNKETGEVNVALPVGGEAYLSRTLPDKYEWIGDIYWFTLHERFNAAGQTI